VARSPSLPPQIRLPVPSEEKEAPGFTPHNDARQRVRQHNRQRRRKVREEEERRALEERERQDRVQRALPQVEAHRREAARRAAEMHRRDRVEKENTVHQQEQLNSARREKTKQYMTPEAINDIRRTDPKLPALSRPVGPQILRDISSSEGKAENRRAHRPASEDDSEGRVLVSGNFSSGVRGRLQPLSPRRREAERQAAADSKLLEARIPDARADSNLPEATAQQSTGAQNISDGPDSEELVVPPEIGNSAKEAAEEPAVPPEIEETAKEAAEKPTVSSPDADVEVDEGAEPNAPPQADAEGPGPDTSLDEVPPDIEDSAKEPAKEETSFEEKSSPQVAPAEEASETQPEKLQEAGPEDQTSDAKRFNYLVGSKCSS